MLRSFRFSNHRAFRDEQELLLLPAYDKRRPVIPVAALYGANASGKSTVLTALDFMRRAVVDSYSRWEPDGGVPCEPFKLDRRSRQSPSAYVVDVVVDAVRYVYGFTVDDERIREEWLYTYPRGRRRLLFERDGDDIEFGASLAGPKSAAHDLTRPNALFLSLAVRVGLEEVLPVYTWFVRSLNRPSARVWPGSGPGLAAAFERHPERARRIHSLLPLADLGISDIRIVETRHTAGSVQDLLRFQRRLEDYLEREFPDRDESDGDTVEPHFLRELFFVHGSGDNTALLRYSEESHGTQVWLTLLWRALAALDGGHVLAVDEIDSSLHPALVAAFVQLFEDEESNPHGAQLIFTAHDTSLMGTALDAEVLRRDEIWFVEKGADGASRLFPLTDFHPRKGENPERRYLGGSYGAVPVVDENGFRQAASDKKQA